MTSVDAAPVGQGLATEEAHFVCCQWVVKPQSPEPTFCGLDASKMKYAPDQPVSCVVCSDLGKGPTCPRGGACTDEAWA